MYLQTRLMPARLALAFLLLLVATQAVADLRWCHDPNYGYSETAQKCRDYTQELIHDQARIVHGCRIDSMVPLGADGYQGAWNVGYYNFWGGGPYQNGWNFYCPGVPHFKHPAKNNGAPPGDGGCGAGGLGGSGGGGGGGGGGFGGGGGPSLCVGDPINAATGNAYRAEDDVRAGKWLRFTRFYNSDSTAVADTMGPHWRHTWSRVLKYQPPNGSTAARVDLVREDGKGSGWVQAADKTWYSDNDVNDGLTEVVDAQGTPTAWTLRRADTRAVERYDATGRLVGVDDPEGFTTQLDYSTTSTPTTVAPTAGLLIAVTDPLQRSMQVTYDASGRVASVTAPTGESYTYTYDAAGNLATVGVPGGKLRRYLYGEAEHTSGVSQPYALTGIVNEANVRALTHDYAADGRAISTKDAGDVNAYTLRYRSDGSLDVRDPTGTTRHRTFVEKSGTFHAASVDGPCWNCSRIAAWTYDELGNFRTLTDFNGVSTTFGFDDTGLITERTDAVGTPDERTIQTSWDQLRRVPTQRLVMDAKHNIVAITRWAYNARGQVVARCEIDPADSAATNSVCSDTTAPNANAKLRRWTYTYCSAADAAARNSTCPIVGLLKRLNGPRPVGDAGMLAGQDDVTTYTYRPATDESRCSSSTGNCFRKGDLWKVTNALGHVTEYVSYDRSGRVRRMKDANGVLTDLSYTARGWLAKRTLRAAASGATSPTDSVTTFAYNDMGDLVKMTQPGGASLTYTYDGARRLTGISDNSGNTIRYTLNAAGNRTKEETKNASRSLKRLLARQFDAVGRIRSVINAPYAAKSNLDDPSVKKTRYTYDTNGNRLRTTDPLDHSQDVEYDALNRVVRTLDAQQPTRGEVRYVHDALDRLTKVTDPKTLDTVYTYDGLADLTQRSSPDTGVARSDYDLAGNRIAETDSRGVTVRYRYDALNRLSGIVYPAEPQSNVTFAYDTVEGACVAGETFARGRLTRITDPSGFTAYCYDLRGNLVRKLVHIDLDAPTDDTIAYGYDLANRLVRVTYPDGSSVAYTRDIRGLVTDVTRTSGTTTTTLATKINHLPFGPVASLQFATGDIQTRSFDQNYWPTGVASTALTQTYGLDGVGNITTLSQTQPAADVVENYAYDEVYRLKEVRDANRLLVESYSYDTTGNRLSKTTANGTLQAYAYDADSHHLNNVDGQGRGYDSAGNTTSIGSRTLDYAANNRLTRVMQSAYATTFQYNGRGERVRKDIDGTPATYYYDEAGHLIAEGVAQWVCIVSGSDDLSNQGGQPTDCPYGSKSALTTVIAREYVWLDDVPIAMISIQDGQTYVIQSDHLNTPRILTSSAGQIVWSWPFRSNPFGEKAQVGVLPFNLRFPGQYWDGESGMNHNYFRDYDPKTGRYIESDPIGLNGGINSFSYVRQNPLQRADPTGTQDMAVCAISGGEIGCAGISPFDYSPPINPPFDNCIFKCVAGLLITISWEEPLQHKIGHSIEHYAGQLWGFFAKNSMKRVFFILDAIELSECYAECKEKYTCDYNKWASDHQQYESMYR